MLNHAKQLSALLALTAAAGAAHGQIAVKNQGFVPFSDAPINYRSDNLSDPVAKLQKALNAGEKTLEYDAQHGYLKSVLELLKIPVNSQTLVFSKTSFQYRKISPAMPRALYFNDDVYVGQVHDGKVLELVSFDPMQGAIFYILDEKKADKPVFERAELDCTQCHVAAGTRNVPGVLLLSVFTRPTGTQTEHSPAYITGQESPLSERWGGWYVTGTHGSQTHMGNALVMNKENPVGIDREAGANVTSLAAERVYFYSHEPNEPPHVHVDRDDQSAKFWLMPVRLADNLGFGPAELRRIRQLLAENESSLIGRWNERFES